MNLNFLKNLLLKGNLTVTGDISGTGLRTSFNQGSATGDNSFAVGLGAASGEYSHAGGIETIASGRYSHAEGDLTIASGDASHAEGASSVASGDGSHAEGRYSEAKGTASHAAGYGATAAQNYTYAWSDGELGTREPNLSSTREGQYMIDATGGVYIPRNVGIGTDSIDRALTVVGNISATGTIQASTVISRIPLAYTELSAYTLSLSDQSDLITINNSLTSFVYIPNDSSVNFGDGSQVNITRLGSGTVTVSASPGVTLRSADNRNQLRTQNSTATIVKLSANNWLLFGDIS